MVVAVCSSSSRFDSLHSTYCEPKPRLSNRYLTGNMLEHGVFKREIEVRETSFLCKSSRCKSSIEAPVKTAYFVSDVAQVIDSDLARLLEASAHANRVNAAQASKREQQQDE